MAHLFPKLATLALISALSLPAGAETPDITGHWRSVAPETQGQITATREFRIDATGWSVTFRAHAAFASQAQSYGVLWAGPGHIGRAYRVAVTC